MSYFNFCFYCGQLAKEYHRCQKCELCRRRGCFASPGQCPYKSEAGLKLKFRKGDAKPIPYQLPVTMHPCGHEQTILSLVHYYEQLEPDIREQALAELKANEPYIYADVVSHQFDRRLSTSVRPSNLRDIGAKLAIQLLGLTDNQKRYAIDGLRKRDPGLYIVVEGCMRDLRTMTNAARMRFRKWKDATPQPDSNCSNDNRQIAGSEAFCVGSC